MTTAYTSLLGLALPVTGELDGTWGDTVNNYITSYVDAAVEGTQTISGSQTAVTLSTTTGSSLSQAGSGSTGSAQYAVINCTGNPASLLTITAPASSRNYIIINSTSTSQSVKIVGVGPTTGVTVASGEKAFVVWDGSDFVRVATSTAGAGTVTSVSWTGGIVSVATATTTPAFTIAGTSGGIPYFSSGTTWASSAALAANAIVLGGGAGAAPATTTTGTGVVTALGNATNATGGFTTIDGTATLTNKRVTPRVSTTTSSATPTINTDNVDMYGLTAQAVDITSFTTNLSGTPTNGQKLWIYIVGTAARAITWGASFEASTVALPTTTVTTNRLDVGFVWNAATSKWRCVAVA